MLNCDVAMSHLAGKAACGCVLHDHVGNLIFRYSGDVSLCQLPWQNYELSSKALIF